MRGAGRGGRGGPRDAARPHGPRRARGAAGAPAASARWWPRSATPASAWSTRSHAIADLCAEHGARLHVDAAYGGFFALLADGGDPGVGPRAVRRARARADSIVVDPHKHGLQPYGCGCVVFADPAVGRLYAHDSPYTYFTSADLHLGEISLECSRAGAAAAALWTTLRALPLTRDGLGRTWRGARAAALRVAGRARRRRAWRSSSRRTSTSSARSRRRRPRRRSARRCERAFDALAADGWHVAKLRVDAGWLAARHPGRGGRRADTVTTLRCCLMKPEHLAVATGLAAALAAHLADAAA